MQKKGLASFLPVCQGCTCQSKREFDTIAGVTYGLISMPFNYTFSRDMLFTVQ